MGTASLLDNGSLRNGYRSDDSGLGTSTNSGLTVAHSHHVSAPPRPFSPTQCRSPFLTPNLQPPQKNRSSPSSVAPKNWCLFVEINLSTSNQQPPKILKNLHDKKKLIPDHAEVPVEVELRHFRIEATPWGSSQVGWHTPCGYAVGGCVETPPTVKCSKLSGHASSSKKKITFGIWGCDMHPIKWVTKRKKPNANFLLHLHLPVESGFGNIPIPPETSMARHGSKTLLLEPSYWLFFLEILIINRLSSL